MRSLTHPPVTHGNLALSLPSISDWIYDISQGTTECSVRFPDICCETPGIIPDIPRENPERKKERKKKPKSFLPSLNLPGNNRNNFNLTRFEHRDIKRSHLPRKKYPCLEPETTSRLQATGPGLGILRPEENCGARPGTIFWTLPAWFQLPADDGLLVADDFFFSIQTVQRGLR